MHEEKHQGERSSGCTAATVLGADDGIVSTASLMIGVAAASASQRNVLIAGVAGLVAGALSKAGRASTCR
jgi:VIT1/CCC1 family predicted Fe2+/Mn2+ transporter